jgi:Pin2-interacting protein X1
MNKMGWQDGQGLGKNKDGQKDHIKVRVKNNALGVGAKKGNDDNWIELQASFNNLLENLTKSHELGTVATRPCNTCPIF